MQSFLVNYGFLGVKTRILHKRKLNYFRVLIYSLIKFIDALMSSNDAQ